ncbi:hypothetical protein B0J11DRAFT_605261 [Dendryphion nanum]|uniref:Uncharacterized protein n=1 Tax=Dendryphion nanum TaxID=256645 RepID=A0A9P9DY66_9PLEO|nr:hypothetical protein B0J11DRAFT_605261 [Dendryphion nanum]
MIQIQIQNTPLLSLAPEILGFIVDGLGTWELHADLKALRRTCRQLAYSPSILERLFRHIKFSRTTEGLRSFQELDPGRFAPYVQSIRYWPSNYSVAVTRVLFEEAVNWQVVSYNMEETDKISWGGVGNILIEKKDIQEVVKTYFNGVSPFFSHEELDTAYDLYHQTAQNIENLPFEKTWTTVLGQLNKCTSISTTHSEVDDSDYWYRNSPREDKICALLPKHPHDHRHHKEVDCLRAQTHTGDMLFENIIVALAISGLRLENLHINHYCSNTKDWLEIPEFPSFDISALKKLTFDPILALHDRNDHELSPRVASNLTLLLRKCVSTLSTLSIGSETMIFPFPDNILLLPALHTLRIGSGYILISLFADFLMLQSGLKRLEMKATHGIPNSGDWRAIWDAIKDHKNRMRLEFEEVAANSATEFGISHWTGDASDEGVGLKGDKNLDSNDEDDEDEDENDDEDDYGDDGEDDDEDETWMDIDRSFKNYVSGNGPWNRCMQMWFEE